MHTLNCKTKGLINPVLLYFMTSRYSVDPGNTGIPVGCVIRCLPDVTLRGMFSVEKVDQLSGILPLEPNEELVSNIIKVTHEDANFKVIISIRYS